LQLHKRKSYLFAKLLFTIVIAAIIAFSLKVSHVGLLSLR
jgi:hypothetical protein